MQETVVMKKAIFMMAISLTVLFSACGVTQPGVSTTPTPAPVANNASGQSEPTAVPTSSVAPTQSQSHLYDPSIFVIEASGQWQDELAPDYFANNECEIYLHKIDPNDNRAVEGSYQGVFWFKSTLDASGFISDLIGDAPIDMTFDAGGESVCDNLAISLNTTDDKAWTDYSILDENGDPLPLTRDTPVGKGSFVAVTKSVYLEAHESGAQGESVDYSDASEGDLIDINYVIHVAPDSMETDGQRNVAIYLGGDGFNVTLDGVMKRLPGYPEDVSDYLNSQDYADSAWRHLSE